MNIYFSDQKRTFVYQLPVVPEDMPELDTGNATTDTFTGNDGTTYIIPQGTDIGSFSIECFLPPQGVHRGYIIKSDINPMELINFWNNNKKTKTPIKCIQTRQDDSEIINWFVIVDSLNWYYRNNGDIKYKVSFKQYNNPADYFVITPAKTALVNAIDALKKVNI